MAAVSHQVIREVCNNLTPGFEAHYLKRQEAVGKAMGMLKAVYVANPGAYWRVESWEPDGNARSTIRAGAGANSTILADYSVLQRTLDDVHL
jgi:hypothetical protein